MKNGEKIVQSFEKWRNEDVSRIFGVRRIEDAPQLREWLQVDGAPPPAWQAFIDHLRYRLTLHKISWNEIELLSQFIAPFLQTIDFADAEKGIEVFSGRTLTLTYKNDEIKGEPDWLVARGDYEPRTPFFFLHEYKRFKQSGADPLGQLLIAMLAAQRLNNDGLPIYGVWIMGKSWQFVILEEDFYSESYTYDATKQEALTQIWLILNKTKQIIYDRVDKLIAIEKAEKQ